MDLIEVASHSIRPLCPACFADYSRVSSRFIHGVVCVTISLLVKPDCYGVVWVGPIVDPSVGPQTRAAPSLAAVSGAAVHTGVKINYIKWFGTDSVTVNRTHGLRWWFPKCVS